MSAYLLLCVSAYTNMYICVCMYLCIFMFMNQCVHMYVCMYMYYLCMYICIDLYTCLSVSVYLPYAYLSIYLINKKKMKNYEPQRGSSFAHMLLKYARFSLNSTKFSLKRLMTFSAINMSNYLLVNLFHKSKICNCDSSESQLVLLLPSFLKIF